MKRLVLVGILALILLAGCISTPSQPAGQPAGGGNQAATAGTGGQQTGEQATGTQGGAGETVSEQIGNLGEALAQSVPMECTATITDQGVTTTTHYWVKSGNMRAESQMAGQTSIVVVKGEKAYVDASVMQLPEGVDCAWIEFEAQEAESEPSAYSETVSEYQNPANIQAECHAAVFGDEKFATPGKICTMDDLIPPMEELPPGYEACSGLSGQDLIDCMMEIQPS